MALIHQKKKKHLPIVVGAVISVIIVIVIVFLLIGKKNVKDENAEMSSDNITLENISTEEIEMTTEYVEKSKEYYIEYVEVGDEQETDEFLDIRIRFPNGEDYIVVTGKTITYLTDKGFYMYLDEKELHMLSSARTDVDVYDGSKLYLASYRKQQENIFTDYPINLFVLSSYPSFFDNADQIYSRRLQLEENLLKFMNQTLQK